MRRAAGRTVLLAAFISACAPAGEPPGRSTNAAATAVVVTAAPSGSAALAADAAPGAAPDRAAAKVATEPNGAAKVASVAMRTWIYAAPSDRSAKLGYLRAGAVVERGEEPVGHDGCKGGWYRVAPRGHVCVGKGASLELDHPVVRATGRGPDRGAALPYGYAIAKRPPPHLYFRLPSRKEQERAEGGTLGTHLARSGLPPESPRFGEVPPFLGEGNAMPKPYGAEAALRYSAHAGRSKSDAAFGLVATFDWTGRRFGQTTELDLIALDRTRVVRGSEVHGAVVVGEGVPAIVPPRRSAAKYRRDERGVFRDDGLAPARSAWVLTGKNNGSETGLLETTEGVWIAAEALLVPEFREDPAGFSREGKKWIDVSIRRQMLVAYEGRRPVFAALVSTGVGEMGDPEKTHATVRGTFMIHAKHVSATMDGDESSDAFELRDVPYVQYFHEGFALHGAYWHDAFGRARSHGCVNLAPADAAWLFEWTDPPVPPEWHGAVNLEAGTLVYTHR